MNLVVSIVAGAALVCSLCVALLFERIAGTTGLIDVPNARSSHAIPTPRGGGVAIVIASLTAGGVLVASDLFPERLYIGLAGGGALVAAIGFIDDHRSLSAALRVLVHLLAAMWAVAWIGAIPFVGNVESGIVVKTINFGLCTLGIVWFLNIFNFMDGIDGIAVSEAIFTCGGMVWLGWELRDAGPATASFVLSASALGFVPRNWPKARIFMGDVGSGYLGFMIAALGVAESVQRPATVWPWIILVGVFAVDSSVTLIRRLARGDALTVAHRTHAYQKLAQKFGHRKVTIAVIGIDVLWLLPCAVLSVVWSAYASWIAVIALFPLAWLAVAIKAGVPTELVARFGT